MKTTIKMSVFILLVFTLAVAFVSFTSAATTQSACSTISTLGVYQLNQSINSSTHCLTITADNVEVDCPGIHK